MGHKRWAILMRVKAGEDLVNVDREIVISIASQDSDDRQPPLSSKGGNYRVTQVPEGVRVGMVVGGPIESVGGFGWRTIQDRPEGAIIDDKRRGGFARKHNDAHGDHTIRR